MCWSPVLSGGEDVCGEGITMRDIFAVYGLGAELVDSIAWKGRDVDVMAK